MGVTFQWATPDHLIMNCVIEHPWTWKEYQACVDEVVVLITDARHPVATTVDVSRMKALPTDGNALKNLQRVDLVMPKNVFYSVIVGAPHVAMVFMNIMMKLNPKVERMTAFTKTMEEAHKLIRERHNQLYPKQPDS